MTSFLDRKNTVAPPGYSRWLVPPAALAVHLSHEVSNGQNAVFAKDLYYECNGVTTVRKYTRTEALVLGIRHLHWGPWA